MTRPPNSNPLQNHLGCISKLVNSDHRTNLATYVIISSFAKTFRRITQNRLLFDYLIHVRPELSDLISSSRPFPLASDRHPVYDKRDGDFLNIISSPHNAKIFNMSDVRIPNLLVTASEWNGSSGSKPPSIYTKDTCMEVHRLLAFLLVSFLDRLIKLQAFTTYPSSQNDIDNFRASSISFVEFTYFLHSLAYSSFIGEHLRRLNPPDFQTFRSHHHGQTTESEDDEEDDDDLDSEELRHMQPEEETLNNPSALSRFLRVICSKMESVANLQGAVVRICRPISIYAVATHTPSRTVREWRHVMPRVMASKSTSILISQTSPASAPPHTSLTAPIDFPQTTNALSPLSKACTHEDAIKIMKNLLEKLNKIPPRKSSRKTLESPSEKTAGTPSGRTLKIPETTAFEMPEEEPPEEETPEKPSEKTTDSETPSGMALEMPEEMTLESEQPQKFEKKAKKKARRQEKVASRSSGATSFKKPTEEVEKSIGKVSKKRKEKLSGKFTDSEKVPTDKLTFSGSIHCEALLAGLMCQGRIPVSQISLHRDPFY